MFGSGLRLNILDCHLSVHFGFCSLGAVVSSRSSIRMKVLLFVVPAVTLFLVASQEYQSLYYKSLDLIEADGHYLVILDKGPWYWVYTGYQLLLIALSFSFSFVPGAGKKGRISPTVSGCFWEP